MKDLIKNLQKLAKNLKAFNVLPDFKIGDELMLWWDFKDGKGVQEAWVKVLPGQTALDYPKFEVLGGPLEHIGEKYTLDTRRTFIPPQSHGYYELVKPLTEKEDQVEEIKLVDAPYYFVKIWDEGKKKLLEVSQFSDLKTLYNYLTDALITEQVNNTGRVPRNIKRISFEDFEEDMNLAGSSIAYDSYGHSNNPFFIWGVRKKDDAEMFLKSGTFNQVIGNAIKA